MPEPWQRAIYSAVLSPRRVIPGPPSFKEKIMSDMKHTSLSDLITNVLQEFGDSENLRKLVQHAHKLNEQNRLLTEKNSNLIDLIITVTQEFKESENMRKLTRYAFKVRKENRHSMESLRKHAMQIETS